MATVCYLLGAGASAQCIPVVNGMAKDIQALSKDLPIHFDVNLSQASTKKKQENLVFIRKSLLNLKQICESHYSIDTYAKKLYLTDKDHFHKLKLDLSMYFSLRQIMTPPDNRYDNFFSSIMTSAYTLPPRINIISWNYDFQLERAFLEFKPTADIHDCRSILGVVSPQNCESFVDYYSKFNVIKLNGSALVKTKDFEGFLFRKFTKVKSKIVQEIADNYINILASKLDYECELKFAWENEAYEPLFKLSEPSLSKISVLVIIGYSFPFFNREVDSMLLNKMKSLQKIYIQDPNPDGIKETLGEFFDLTSRHKQSPEVIFKTNLNQFVFPKELDITS